MIPKSESEIVRNWGPDKPPVVSVCCTTFNHEDYIATALDSFLMQETRFPFEIIVRDDCSSDGTAATIESYADKYPNIIKPIYESENQFSLGIRPMSAVFEKATGEFIAFCEGDDYWTDPLKLQKQLDVFRKEPDVSICFHPAVEKDVLNDSSTEICQHFQQDQTVPIADVIRGRGSFMPTASIMFERHPLDSFYELITGAPIGDYFLQIYLASLGHTYYLKDTMCVYRRNATNSWTKKQLDSDFTKEYSRQMVISLDRFSAVFEDANHKEILFQVIKFYLIMCITNTQGLIEKVKVVTEICKELEYYDQFHYKSGLFLSLIRNLV